MDITAKAKFVRISPKKAIMLVRSLRGQKTTTALAGLKNHPTKTSGILKKLIDSAVANAKNNYNLKEDNLKIKRLTVDEGPTAKRYWFRSRGSADQLLKRASHFEVILTEINPTLIKKKVTKQSVEASASSSSKTTTITKPKPIAQDIKKSAQRVALRASGQRTTNK
jgi:large subunit ribosomal protein L22